MSEIATREPQLAYSAFVYGLSKRWNYVCRTTPGISDRLKPLEFVTREDFIPAILNRSFSCTDELREIFHLPPRFGGLGIPKMTEIAENEYSYSTIATKSLKDAIMNQDAEYIENAQELHDVKSNIAKDRTKKYEERKKEVLEPMAESSRLMLELAAEKGASSWSGV